MSDIVREFNEYRQKMNDRILATDNLVVKRFFNLDTNTYQGGALPAKTKEMLGLVASMVLRCDDCIAYHVQECHLPASRARVLRDLWRGARRRRVDHHSAHRRAVEFLDALIQSK
jgi:alkylhydroperoxidase family enzyme